MVELKNGHIRKKSHPKVANSRDIAGERKKKTEKKQKNPAVGTKSANGGEMPFIQTNSHVFLPNEDITNKGNTCSVFV